MDAIAKDLDAWMPRLLKVWRRHRRSPQTQPDKLTAAEAREITSGILKLSKGLTRGRELAGEEYLADPALLGAYLLYFWPVSYAQTRHALRNLPAAARRVLDLGSGPGPVGAACLDLGAAHVTFADRSRTATTLAGELARTTGREAATVFWDPDRGSALPAGQFDLIVSGHLFNELWPESPDRIGRRFDLMAKLRARLAPGGLIFLLEPALTPTSRDLLALRDRLLSAGYALLSPCLWKNQCPALAKPGDTCHEEFAWTPPALVRALIQKTGFQKRTLKMSTLLLTPPGGPAAPPADPLIFRIVSDPLLSKNKRVRLLGCGTAGRLSLALKPELATDENRVFLSLKRGDVIRVFDARPREGGGLDITSGTRIELVLRANPA